MSYRIKQRAGLGLIVIFASIGSSGVSQAQCEVSQYNFNSMVAAREELDGMRAEVFDKIQGAAESDVSEKLVLVLTYETVLRSLDHTNIVLNMLSVYPSRASDPEARQLLEEMINWAAGSYRRQAEVQVDSLTSIIEISENYWTTVAEARDRVDRWSQSLECRQ